MKLNIKKHWHHFKQHTRFFVKIKRKIERRIYNNSTKSTTKKEESEKKVSYKFPLTFFLAGLLIFLVALAFSFYTTSALANNAIVYRASVKEPNTIRFPKEIKIVGFSENSGIASYKKMSDQVIMFSIDDNATKTFVINAVLIDDTFMSFRVIPDKKALAGLYPKADVIKKSVKKHYSYYPSLLIEMLRSIRQGDREKHGFSQIKKEMPWTQFKDYAIRESVRYSNGEFDFIVVSVFNNTDEDRIIEYDEFYQDGVIAIEKKEKVIRSKGLSQIIIISALKQLSNN